MRQNLIFRAWFYFRQGWATYFAFGFAAINTLVTTYYLAIKDAPILKAIFPSFSIYVGIISAIGIPLLVAIGYVHYKKIAAFSSETDVQVESNPYYFKLAPGYTTEVVFPMYLKMLEMILKLSKSEKLTETELKEIAKLQKKMEVLIRGGYVGKPKNKASFSDEIEDDDYDIT